MDMCAPGLRRRHFWMLPHRHTNELQHFDGKVPYRLGRYYWQLGVSLGWLVWVPVPVEMTLTDLHTVAF